MSVLENNRNLPGRDFSITSEIFGTEFNQILDTLLFHKVINIAELADTTHGGIITTKTRYFWSVALSGEKNQTGKMGKYGSTDAYYIILFSNECLKIFKIGELW